MFGALKKRISRTFRSAGELLSGPTPAKQFRNAILERDEEKAINLYNGAGETADLAEELHPSRPFPSKKDVVADSPLFLAAKFALEKLVMMLLARGGDPSALNMKQETCLHAICSMSDHAELRATILDELVNWVGIDEQGQEMDKVSLNKVDVDGNTAIHYAASNGLVHAVEKLVALGAIISIVNKSNITCCELADQQGCKELALMLELALVFQPEDDLQGFDRFAGAGFANQTARLILDTATFSTGGLAAYVDECVTIVSRRIGWMNSSMYRSRAEQLLNTYAWNVDRLLEDYLTDSGKVLSAAKMTSPAPKEEGEQSKVSDETEAVPEKGPTVEEACLVCGDGMRPPADLIQFTAGNVEEPERRALSCLSGHSFCISCWSGHLSVQISDHSVGCIPCPGFKCGEILDLCWAPVLLKSPDMVNRLEAARLRHIVDYADMKCCPIDNCGLVVQIPADLHRPQASNSPTPGTPGNTGGLVAHTLPTAAICSSGHMFCLQCSAVAHSPCGCADYLQWSQLVAEQLHTTTIKEGANSDEIANALWVAANTKRCPRCSTAIEKDEGCNHMNCRKCRKEFCWICMQDWSLHSDNTGGYFQCNRYVENTPAEEGIWAQERGNAHADAVRAREKSRRMNRFIHHFTRYKAHGDSMSMEKRMHKETLRRIQEGLLSSKQGHLKWLQGTVVPNPLDAESNSPMKATIATPATPRESGPDILKHTVSSDKCIAFLDQGFIELLKTRLFLQFSYAYAYFEFLDCDDSNETNRRGRWTSRVEDHRTSFELLQADLESTVETLSDVCARRRLRASESQIVQATRAAKQKRIELESLLIAYSSMKLAQRETPSAGRAGRGSAQRAVGTTPGSAVRNRAASFTLNRTRTANTGNRSANRPVSGWRRTGTSGDMSDSLDLATLLLELELANVGSDSPRPPPPPPTDEEEEGIASTAGATPPRPQSVRTRLNNLFALENTDAIAAANEHTDDQPYDSEEDNNDATDATPHLRDRDMMRLARRAEEATALNRAILMSLQDPPSRADADGNVAAPSELHVETLQAMGFTQEQAEQALRESGDNVEMAANRLLGADADS